MKHLKIALVLLTLLFSLQGYAQNAPLPCGTSEVMEQLFKENPKLREQFENEKPTIPFEMEKSANGVRYVVPIVVHIVYYGNAANISDAQVYDAIRIINEDFQFRGRDTGTISALFKPVAGNPEFEFRLARRDPRGNCTNGITRSESILSLTASDNVKRVPGAEAWATDKYLNVWVASKIYSGTNVVGGYAYFPGSAPGGADGILVDDEQFGSIGTSSSSNFSSRTLTHELGHYFNLRHVWGNGQVGDPTNCNSSSGDLVDDTPVTKGTANQGCALNTISCTQIPNVENYMDYSNCGRMFTRGQVQRMTSAITGTAGNRNRLWTQSNLVAAGVADGLNLPVCVPIASVSAPKKQVCVGGSLDLFGSFRNAPMDTSVKFKWKIQGATQPVQTTQDAVAELLSPGFFDVTFIVENSSGKDSIVLNDYIHAIDTAPVISVQHIESMDQPNWPNVNANPDKNWQASTDDPTLTVSPWLNAPGVGLDGGNAIKLDMTQLLSGTKAFLVSPLINRNNLPAGRRLSISYHYAFAGLDDTAKDNMKVEYSTNCTSSWTNISTLERRANTRIKFSTVAGAIGVPTIPFVPAANEWRFEQASVVGPGNYPVNIRFNITAAYGNTFYLDNVVIHDGSYVLQTLKPEDFSLFKVFPNPATNKAVVELQSYHSGPINISVVDVLGRNTAIFDGTLEAGVNQQFPIENLSKGIYLVRVQLGKSNLVEKLVIN